MNEYAFPKELLEVLYAQWVFIQPAAATTMPNNPTLQWLLETCYHASLRTAELRTTRCVLAYVSKSALANKSLLRFKHPATLTVSELVRLAPITELNYTVIGCHHIDGAVRIWGLIEYGQSELEKKRIGFTASPAREEVLPPDCLTISIEGPGELSVARGERQVVRLREGRIIPPHEHQLLQVDEPLGRFFEALVQDLWSTVAQASNPDICRDDWERLLDTYIMVIASILERIRSERHGGSLVISATPLDEMLAHPTYTTIEDAPLVDDILNHCGALKRLQAVSNYPTEATSEVARYRAEASVRMTSHYLARGVKRVSLLAALDGAVLLDGRLGVEGFGVRFPVLLPPGTTILDALNGIEYPCDEWGLRHQSIYSVCQQCEQAVGFVVSQDGSVKGVKNVSKRLQFWDGILD